MKESITKFDLEAAFKALDDIEIPVAEKGIRANKPALTEIFSNKSKLDVLMEEYYDINNTGELENAKEDREAEVAKAKLARIEKIVDLDAKSPDDLLTSYVGKFIIQCPQCMTLFYKNPEDVENSEEDENIVNVNEVCQHCGNESGYTLIGKVGAAEAEDTFEGDLAEPETGVEDAEEVAYEGDETAEESEEDFDLGDDLDDIDLEIEDDELEDTKEESLSTTSSTSLTEDIDLEVSAEEFEKLINSSEFKKPISDSAARAMLNSEEDSKEDTKEAFSEEALKNVVDTEEPLEEGIFDKAKEKLSNIVDKIASKLKSREDKADWILANAIVPGAEITLDEKGNIELTDDNKRFSAFLVIGFTDKYSNGKVITMAPRPDNKDLVVGNIIGANKKIVREAYKDADNIAKGWSQKQGNGPAFIYLVKSEDDEKAVFLCEYFKGELANDQLNKYFELVKKDLEGSKLMAKGGVDPNEIANDDEPNIETKEESLSTVMENIEDLHEESLAKAICESLTKVCGNVANFKITDCEYLDEQLHVTGDISFNIGKPEKTAYVFTEAFIENDEIRLQGTNKRFDLNEKFNIVGHIEKENKTFITESFK